MPPQYCKTRWLTNRPFPSSLAPLFQNESKCETFHMTLSSACSFILMQSHFHKNGFALRLALKQRHKGTRKWPIKHSYLEKQRISYLGLFSTRPLVARPLEALCRDPHPWNSLAPQTAFCLAYPELLSTNHHQDRDWNQSPAGPSEEEGDWGSLMAV